MDVADVVIEQLAAIVGPRGVLTDPNELFVYENDGFPIAKGLPLAVVTPTDTAQVSRCVKVLGEHGLSIVPRGSGTGLTGGAVVFDRGVLISTTRMDKIESIDPANRVAVVQAGVRNRQLNDAVAKAVTREKPIGGRPDPSCLVTPSLRFAPDPSSERVSTIGGNAATNAGGISTLKYGVTSHHILGLEMVLPDGGIVVTRPGGLCDGIGSDLPGLVCGSEGTLGIITRLWCRLTAVPLRFCTVYTVFSSTRDACEAVSDIIASGIVPTSMEMLDGTMIRVVDEAFGCGFPVDAKAMVLMEIDGVKESLLEQCEQISQICHDHGVVQICHSTNPQERAELWSVRKRAFGAIGRISRSYCTQDACVPRSMLAEAMARITQIGREHGLVITSVFHAGDGNIHPILLFDEDDPKQVQRTLRVSQEILEYCVSIGGTISGEHGIGVEKLHVMPKMFNADTLDAFSEIKEVFDPGRRVNDGKLIPSPKLQVELLQPVSPNIPGGAL